MLNFSGLWEDHVHLMEFAYKSYQLNIKMAQFEALYGKKYRSPIYLDDIGCKKLLEIEMITQIVHKINLI